MPYYFFMDFIASVLAQHMHVERKSTARYFILKIHL